MFVVSYLLLIGIGVSEAGQVSRGWGSVQGSVDKGTWEGIRQHYQFV